MQCEPSLPVRELADIVDVLRHCGRQPLVGLRMEDPSLPLPRFSPIKRKMRPDPIDAMAGIERVKVGLDT